MALAMAADAHDPDSHKHSDEPMPDRLMHGENVESWSPEEVTHWISAYSELIAFKNGLLTDMNRGMKSLSKPASAEIQELDVNLMETQRARYARRLDFWLARQTEMDRRRKPV